METLRVDASFTQRDFPDLEHYSNLKEVHLHWSDGHSVKDVLLVLRRCTHLRRLTLESWTYKFDFSDSATLEEFCDFIVKMKHLTLVHIVCNLHNNHELVMVRRCDIENCLHFKSVVDKVKAFVLPRRPNFKFYISCCYMFDETRVSSCTWNK